MTAQESYELEVGAGRVRVALVHPHGGKTPGVVLLITDPPTVGIAPLPYLDGLVAAFAAAGLAVATFEYRLGDEATRDEASAAVDDASAVFRSLLLRSDVDIARVGIVGVRLGAIIACGLAARSDQVNRVALMSPAVNDDSVAKLLDETHVTDAYVASLTELTPSKDLARYDRPTLITHGAADREIPAASARVYADALALAGHAVDHWLAARADHALTDVTVRGVVVERLVGFLADMSALVPA